MQIGALKDPEALAEAVARGGARRAIRSHLRLCRIDGRLGSYLRTRLKYTAEPLVGLAAAEIAEGARNS